MENIFEKLILKYKEIFINKIKINPKDLIYFDINDINFSNIQITYIDENILIQNINIYNLNDIIFKSLLNNIISYYNITKKEYKNDYFKYLNIIIDLLKTLPKLLFNNDKIIFYNSFYNNLSSLFEFKINKKDLENINELDKLNIFVFYKFDKDFISILLDIYNFIFSLDCINYITLNIPNNSLSNIYKLKAILSIINYEKIYNTFTFDIFFENLNKLLK